MMRILITGDWHIRASNPKRRRDNFAGAQAGKIRFLLDAAQEYQCKYLIQPGDMTEHYPHPRCPYRITQWYIREFLDFAVSTNWQFGQILTIPGQHDLVNHNDILDTPLMTMESAQVVQILDGGYPLEDITNEGKHIYIYGHTFGTPIPEPRDHNAFNILVTHQMVSDYDYWNHTVRYTDSRRLMRRLPYYKAIICGDNHNHFVTHNSETGQHLFNCGSIMRATIAQRDHKPAAYVYDLDDDVIQYIEIPIQPPEEVFTPDPVAMASRSGVDMMPFVNQLREGRHGLSAMGFVDILWTVAGRRNINRRVKLMIEEDLQNAHNSARA